jgi:hypothetical protein
MGAKKGDTMGTTQKVTSFEIAQKLSAKGIQLFKIL